MKKILSLLICIMLMLGSFSACSIFGAKGGPESPGTSESIDEIISDEEAMNIALSRVPGATADDFTRFAIEQDEGHWIYEGELLYKGIEYEFEIEGCNGNILEWIIDN